MSEIKKESPLYLDLVDTGIFCNYCRQNNIPIPTSTRAWYRCFKVNEGLDIIDFAGTWKICNIKDSESKIIKMPLEVPAITHEQAHEIIKSYINGLKV
jgi:hypothetical protein